MMQHIDRLRAKPEHTRKRIAFFSSFSITAIIFIFWLASFGVRSEVVAGNGATVKPPLTAMTAAASDAFQYAKEMIFGSGQKRSSNSADNIEIRPGKI